MKHLYIFLTLALFLVSCEEEQNNSPGPTPEEGPLKGFTDFPFDGTFDGILAAYDVIEHEANLVAQHYDGGVPWVEAYANQPYLQSFQDEIAAKVQLTPSGHAIYLAATPIHFDRNRLAAYRGETQTGELPPDWDDDTFDTLKVREAYLNYCRFLIAQHRPDYFVYAIEANMLHFLAPQYWDGFVGLAEYVYSSLKDSFEFPIGVSIQADFYWQDPAAQEAALAPLWPYMDFVGISAYPFTGQANPDLLRDDYLTVFSALSGGEPLAIAETSWPAETITAPYPITIPADEDAQRRYAEAILGGRLSADWLFVTWFFTRDFDDYWDAGLSSSPIAATIRIWKDTGLYRGDGTERPALDVWRGY
ncbi:MAG: hypothetical protein H6505_06405 [Calditrichaeota bacterium]|nr:hypothetical protein [Calditrichota bacterium]